MADNKFAMDYIDVAQRIVEFREKHPEGALQPADLSKPYTIETIGDQTYIVVVAAAYRSPEDRIPGIGMAYEPFPGRTPYTRGSELQNAETSAWGRAIVASLAADTRKGIASAEEVRNRKAEQDEPVRQVERPQQTAADKAVELRGQLANVAKAKGDSPEAIAAHFLGRIKKPIQAASAAELTEYLDGYRRNGLPKPAASAA